MGPFRILATVLAATYATAQVTDYCVYLEDIDIGSLIVSGASTFGISVTWADEPLDRINQCLCLSTMDGAFIFTEF